jgi:hypothetical protein
MNALVSHDVGPQKMTTADILTCNVLDLRPPPIDVNGGDHSNVDHEKRITAIETLMPTLATKTDMAEMRADFHGMDASIKTWMIATILGLFFGFAGLFFAMNNSLHAPATPSPTLAPIVIQLSGASVQHSLPEPLPGAAAGK